MRKMMTKEVTKTTVKMARMEVENGLPVAVPLEDKILLGNVSLEKAQRIIKKEHGEGVTVFEVQADTQVYEMAVEEFIKVATLKVEKDSEENEQQESAE